MGSALSLTNLLVSKECVFVIMDEVKPIIISLLTDDNDTQSVEKIDMFVRKVIDTKSREWIEMFYDMMENLDSKQINKETLFELIEDQELIKEAQGMLNSDWAAAFQGIREYTQEEYNAKVGRARTNVIIKLNLSQDESRRNDNIERNNFYLNHSETCNDYST